jgi:hypothetical protein
MDVSVLLDFGVENWVYEERLTFWCRILRPSFFMENFDNFIGSIAVTIMKKGMKEDTTLALIVGIKGSI